MNTEITICRQISVDDSEYWQLRLSIGNQTFTIGEPSDEKEHSEWVANMLQIALSGAGVKNIRIGEVNNPFDRLPKASTAIVEALAADDGQFNPLAHEQMR